MKEGKKTQHSLFHPYSGYMETLICTYKNVSQCFDRILRSGKNINTSHPKKREKKKQTKKKNNSRLLPTSIYIKNMIHFLHHNRFFFNSDMIKVGDRNLSGVFSLDWSVREEK